jgi:hypothetical protein
MIRTQDVIAEAIWQVEEEILSRAAKPLSPHANYWRWFCDGAFGVEAIPLAQPPSDWPKSIGRFQGRLRGDPRDAEATCYIEYLATGPSEAVVSRIVHELAEYLLLVRLPVILERLAPASHLATLATVDPCALRHTAARRIQRSILTRIYGSK